MKLFTHSLIKIRSLLEIISIFQFFKTFKEQPARVRRAACGSRATVWPALFYTEARLMANEQRTQTVSIYSDIFSHYKTTQRKLFHEICCHLELFKTMFMHYVSSIDSCSYIFKIFFVDHPT